MPIKILVLSDLWVPFPGGAERLIFNLSRRLMEDGHDVMALTGYLEAQQFNGPRLTINDSIGVFDDRESGAAIIKDTISSFSPDVILCHHLYANEFQEELAQSGIPLVHVVHHGPTIPEAALGIYNSEWAKGLYDRPENSLTIRPVALDDVIAKTHGNAIGFIKPIKHKGIELLYEVASWLPERQFVVLRGEWKDMEIIEPADNITFIDPVEDIRTFYEYCRIVLMPSRSEDAGTVAQEATLNGLPCISSNVEGILETNGGGVLLDRDDALSFVAWIEALDRPDLYSAIVKRQKEYLESVNQEATLDEFARRVIEVFEINRSIQMDPIKLAHSKGISQITSAKFTVTS